MHTVTQGRVATTYGDKRAPDLPKGTRRLWTHT